MFFAKQYLKIYPFIVAGLEIAKTKRQPLQPLLKGSEVQQGGDVGVLVMIFVTPAILSTIKQDPLSSFAMKTLSSSGVDLFRPNNLCDLGTYSIFTGNKSCLKFWEINN